MKRGRKPDITFVDLSRRNRGRPIHTIRAEAAPNPDPEKSRPAPSGVRVEPDREEA